MSSSSEITNKANSNGKQLETFVTERLETNNYIFSFTANDNSAFKRYVPQAVVGRTIYGTTLKCDFLVFGVRKFPNKLIIECKWQQVGGTADEKYPYLLENIKKTGIPTIVLLDGNGYRKASKEWLISKVKRENSLVAVFSMSDFQREVNNGLLE
jgi:hypothetical protein